MGPCNSVNGKKDQILYDNNFDYEWSNKYEIVEKKSDLVKISEYKLKTYFYEFIEDEFRKKKKFLVCKYFYISGDGKIKSIVPILGTDEKIFFEGIITKSGVFKMNKKIKKMDSILNNFYDGTLEHKIKDGLIIEGFYSQIPNNNGVLLTENKASQVKKEFIVEFSKNTYKVEYSEKYAKDFLLFLDIEENENIISYIGGISWDDKGVSVWRGFAEGNNLNTNLILIQQYLEDQKIFASEGSKRILYEGKYDRFGKKIDGFISTQDLNNPVKFRISFISRNDKK